MQQLPPHLYDFVKQKVDFSEFLETEMGCKLQWTQRGRSAKCVCPMPHHRERAASFCLNFLDDSHVWVFYCFGCGSKGTIIDFFMDYYQLNSSAEALVYICNRFKLKPTDDFDVTGLRDLKKKAHLDKKMEYIHIVTSNQCRMLLRKDYGKYREWVALAYREMNKALDKEDLSIIEKIGFMASNKMGEK